MNNLPPPAPAVIQAPQLTPEQITERYIALRNKKAEIVQRHKEELEPFVTHMDRLESMILEQMNTSGVTSYGTPAGTAYRAERTYYKTEDGEVLLDFLKANNLVHLLERKLSKDSIEEYVAQHGQLPPGVTCTTEVTVGFRKK